MKATPEMFGNILVGGHRVTAQNRYAFCETFNKHAPQFGYDLPHRLAQIIGQVGHESMGLRYTYEIWGPTKAQRGYEGRKDLGNTQPGDGRRFKGHLDIHVTGRENHRKFTRWLWDKISKAFPDFEKNPEILESTSALKYLGLSTIWYFSTRVPTALMDRGDYRSVTKRINGGYNGLDDRFKRYGIAATEILGFPSVKAFQEANGLKADGVVGSNTFNAMHRALKALKPEQQQSGLAAIISAILAILGKLTWKRKS